MNPTHIVEMRVHEFELDHDPRRGPLDIDIDHTGLYAGFGHDGLHLGGDVIEAVVGGGGYADRLLHFFAI